MAYTNNFDVSLPIQLWLATDDYDYQQLDLPRGAKYISATTLLKSPRQIILNKRLSQLDDGVIPPNDVIDFFASRFGTSLHDGIENAWTHPNIAQNLRKIGIPPSVIKRIKVNPKPEEIDANTIPVFFEQRAIKEIAGWHVGGKFDAVFDGILNDFKSTSTYSYTKGVNDAKYVQQGSIYRWLNPDLVTKDFMNIQMIFKDWMRTQSLNNSSYPRAPVAEVRFNLMPIHETELFIKSKLAIIDDLELVPEAELPWCNDEELWRSDPVYKYYKKSPETQSRATKNFNDKSEAEAHKLKEGVGVVVEVLGKAKACNYCAAAPTCSQYKEMLENDDIAE